LKVEGFEIWQGQTFRARVEQSMGLEPFEPLRGEDLSIMRRVIVQASTSVKRSCSGLFSKIGDGLPWERLVGRVRRVCTSDTPLAGYVSADNDLCVTRHCFAEGADFTVRVFLHELAHVAGVQADYGGSAVTPATSHIRAHQVEYACTGAPFDASDPAISGMLRSMKAQGISVQQMLQWGKNCGSCRTARSRR
jgi:hypothetical protein